MLRVIEASGLTGRGGAGFPSAAKLRSVSRGRRAVVVANGVEGEPASAKDEVLMIRNPHLVLDGVEAAAALVGAASLFCFHPFGIFSRDNEQAVAMRLHHLADIYEVAGVPDRAIGALQEAVDRCPLHCPQALDGLFGLYVRTSRVADGKAYFTSFTRAHRDHPDADRYLERLLEIDAAGRVP